MILALLSRNWLSSPWCFTEAVTATFRGKDVVGIETEQLNTGDLEQAPPILHERQRIRLQPRSAQNDSAIESMYRLRPNRRRKGNGKPNEPKGITQFRSNRTRVHRRLQRAWDGKSVNSI